MKYYNLYGLVLKTANVIDHLIPSLESEKFDTFITFQEYQTQPQYTFQAKATEVYVSDGFAPNNIPYLSVFKQYDFDDEYLVIRYNNGKFIAFFVSDKKGQNVRVYYHPQIPLSDLYTYLLGPVIGCILRLKDKVCLHASVVNINGKAIAFIGEKTAGKSTLIATFAALGYPILSDDIAVLFEFEQQSFVHVAYPRLRLWKNSINNLAGVNIDELQPVLSHIEKYYLPLHPDGSLNWRFQSNPLPLATVYYLAERSDDDIISIQSCKPSDGFLKLKQNIYAEYMLENNLNTKEFEVLGKLANNNQVKLLSRPDDLSVLEEICHAIITNVKT